MNIDDFSDELKWQIATRSATAMPFAYEMVLGDILGDKGDELLRQIWTNGGKEAADLAMVLGFPASNAPEISQAQSVVFNMLYGPELKYETVSKSEDQVLDRITECPMLNRAIEMDIALDGICESCQATNQAFIENMNPNYTQRTTKAMCMGSEYCEMCTELRNK
jgi:hypothetical protein